MDGASRPLQGREVVITGASGGLGGAVVQRALEWGARCHLPVRRSAGLSLVPSDRARVVEGVDLADEVAVSRFYAACPPLWASIHLAGGFAMRPLLECALSDLHQQWSLNVATAFLCTREAARRMSAPAGGRIVNVASRAALVPSGGAVPYSIAKAGVAMLTQSAAEELRGNGVLVNAVAPSIIDTPANRRAMPGADFATWPRAIELAETILWLASPANTLTTGSVVPVYGRA